MKLMTHVVAWYPNLSETKKLLLTLDKYSEYIEIQIPYSDPIADWPIITNAWQVSLDNWFKVSDTFTLLSELKGKISSNILIMTYWNIIFKYWIERFVIDSFNSGVKWFIVPDISPENFKQFFKVSKKYNLKIVSIFAPTSSEKRMKTLAKYSPDLIYVVARTWITWSDTNFWNELLDFLKRIKTNYAWQLAVWFWIKEKKHITFLEWHADFAVMGSEIVKQYDNWWIEQVDRFMKKLIIQ